MTVAEIRRRVEELPSVGTVWQPTGTTVAWYWRQWPWRKTGASAVTLREGMVETIELSIDFALTVKGVVDLYGLPEATHFGPAGLPDYTFFRVDLYYPAQGVEFWVELSPWYAPVLRPGSRVYYAVYTIPAPSLRDWRERLGSELKLHPWPGYGGLPTPQP
jgi:hypothetical protein